MKMSGVLVEKVPKTYFVGMAWTLLTPLRDTISVSNLTNKEAWTALCSVVKHAGSGRARKKCRGKHETQSSVFLHFLSALPLLKCFTTEQSSVEASLFVL